MKDDQPRVARRGFLAGAGIVAAAAGTAALTARTPVAQVAASTLPGATPGDSDSTTYRVSEHIRKYYKTTLL